MCKQHVRFEWSFVKQIVFFDQKEHFFVPLTSNTSSRESKFEKRLRLACSSVIVHEISSLSVDQSLVVNYNAWTLFHMYTSISLTRGGRRIDKNNRRISNKTLWLDYNTIYKRADITHAWSAGSLFCFFTIYVRRRLATKATDILLLYFYV